MECVCRGILSLAWCPQDADLLLTCGKDNRVLCWNPNSAVQTGEVINQNISLNLKPPVQIILVFLHFLLAYCISAFKQVEDIKWHKSAGI